MTSVLVTGASSLVGRFLLPRLAEAGHEVHAVSRRPPPDGAAVSGRRWHALDIETGLGSVAGIQASVLVHLAPIWLLPAIVEDAARDGVSRIVAFSSTSRFTKETSSDAAERRLAARLAEAEAAFIASAGRHSVAWTLFRPTLIYAPGLDRNVSSIARFIRRFHVFPIAGRGSGLRQPVHADDLAVACIATLASRATVGRSYNLGGGSRLTYEDMVREIFRGLGLPPRLVKVPVSVLRAGLEVARRLPRLGHLSPAVADRMDRDLAFDWSDAAVDFGYHPRQFAFPQ